MQGKRDLSVDEASGTRYPIQFMQGGHLQDVPAPLVRVRTCGGFHLEVLQEVISVDPALGRYRLITLEQCPRGSSTGLTLLKMLASRPEHYASKDWLAEYIPRMRGSSDEEEEGWGRGLVRIDNVVSLLRSLLCPPGIAQEDTARKMLVAYIKNHKDSGPGYQLASLPLLWLDIDVIAATVQQACQQEQDGRDALAAWEQIYALAGKGSYLPHEPYSDWAADKRAEIDGYLKQAVLVLRRLLLARYGQAGEERVLLLLRSYWQAHPMDEDVLRPLMELLGKRECVQEALECYQRLCEQIEQEGGTPHLRTQRTVENLRLGQIAPFSQNVPADIIGAYEPEAHKRWLELVTLQEQDLESNTFVDRREASKHLGILGLTLVMAPYRLFDGFPSVSSRRSKIDRETLTLFKTLTETCLRLSEGNQLTTAERVLWSYLPEVEAFTQQSSDHQRFAAHIVSQGYLIAASLVVDV